MARWAVTQWELRTRAAAKFSRAHEMLFVREALEQATHEVVALYHASRFPGGVEVADLTAGIGGDLMALAARGPCVGFELDPERARCASHNVGLVSSQASVQCASGLSREWSYAFADPARRVEGRRTLRVSDFQPSLEELVPLLRRASRGGLKLSPLLGDGELEAPGGELEFVGHGWECREALIWLGRDVRKGRWAVQADSGERLAAAPLPDVSDSPLSWIAEADPAAIRAHALGSLATLLGAVGLGKSNGFLTAPQPVDSSWVRWFEVLDVGSLDEKRLAGVLADRGLRLAAVKPRGVSIDPAAWIRKIKVHSGEAAELLAYPAAGKVRAALCRRKT